MNLVSIMIDADVYDPVELRLMAVGCDDENQYYTGDFLREIASKVEQAQYDNRVREGY